MDRRTRCTALLLSLACSAVALAAPQYGGSKRNQPAPPAAKPPVTGSEDGAQKSKKSETPPSEAKFYERIDAEDRAALQVNVGYLIPAPPADLAWIGGDAMAREDFRGKVTVIQSIGGKGGGRANLEKLKKLLPAEVLLMAVHTPDQADRAKTTFEKNPPCLIAVDADGAWCDALGIWKKPVNLVVDKSGSVRYVGLSEAGFKAKLGALLAEEVDDSVIGHEKPSAKAAPETSKTPEWPDFLAPVGSAQDMRGKQAPVFAVDQWITAQPSPGNRLLAVDFWATWCGPCRAAIPHVNDLQDKYGNDILFVGISDESKSKFTQGMRDNKLKQADFSYALALDPKGRWKDGFFKVKGIPHMVIVSSDGIVRWQGHPMTLQEADLDKLVAANRTLAKAAGDPNARGWAGVAKSAPAKKPTPTAPAK